MARGGYRTGGGRKPEGGEPWPHTPDRQVVLNIAVDILAETPREKANLDRLVNLLTKIGWMKYTRWTERYIDRKGLDRNMKHGPKLKHTLLQVSTQAVYVLILYSKNGLTKEQIMREAYHYSDNMPINEREAITNNSYQTLYKLERAGRIFRTKVGHDIIYSTEKHLAYLKRQERQEEPIDIPGKEAE